MLFGFGSAIVGGFLLTAVQNWTGVPGIKGPLLAVLAGSWLLGRGLIAFGASLPAVLVLIGDVLYLVMVAAAMAYPVIKAKMWRNLMFVPMLLMLALLNVASHVGIVRGDLGLSMSAIHGAVFVITLMIVIIGGRVVPFFTANGLGVPRVEAIRWVDAVSIISLLILLVSAFVGFSTLNAVFLAFVSLVAALANGYRFWRWQFWLCGKVPLLWSLHFAYAFVPFGFLTLFLYFINVVPTLSIALHALTVGAIGGMILSMISRVSLGHMGRPLKPVKIMSLAFGLILVSAIARVVIPWLFPSFTNVGIALAGVFWVLAYGIFCVVYGADFWKPRPDGRPG
ncbi:NnrS family protein [Litoribacillus peritrichatus]|uniref:NnrS family protein n=2 Tax=Litoribacillus peritrichatus TaxID=718191 RepID=A0ABP7N3W7_9GAMM